MKKIHGRARRAAALVAAIAAGALMTACGGNDHNDPPATSEVPSSASASVDGFIEYLKRLVVSSADTLEPVDTSMVTPPVDDTKEPTPVN
jgi:hypothetical protein